MTKNFQQYTVIVEKLVHGGQALGTLADGRKIFVWNALPDEKVVVKARKEKRRFLEGVAIDVIEASLERVEPRDQAFLSTSPWQMMNFEAENNYKQSILLETLHREHVTLKTPVTFYHDSSEWQYRNKMEYSFWGDDDGLHLALYRRASHGKQIITGSSLALPVIDATAQRILDVLRTHKVRAGDLKTVMIRANQAGDAVAALFVKREDFVQLDALEAACKGIVVYYSNPKSPASVITEPLYQFGDIRLMDLVLEAPITYDVTSFFQVNQPVFAAALRRIQLFIEGYEPRIDMYSGVGAIGIALGGAVLIESDVHNCILASENCQNTTSTVVNVPAEKALQEIKPDGALIVDPPRAGLHAQVVDRIKEVRPPRIAYLSCNPITQARDLTLLQEMYNIESIEGFNFFPKTPHIESLALLTRKEG